MGRLRHAKGRGRVRHALLLALLALPALTSAFAAEQGDDSTAEPGADPAAGSSAALLDRYLTEQVEARWWRRKEVLRRGGPVAASQAGTELLEFMRQERLVRLPEMSDALVLEGRSLEQLGDHDGARESFRLAHELDPMSSAALWNEARARWSSGDGFAPSAGLAWRALRVRWADFWTRFTSMINVVYVLNMAVFATALMTLIVLMFREAPALVHAVDEKLPARWHPAWRKTLGWTVVLAPVALLYLGMWALLIWAVALLVVPERRPRWLLSSCLLVLALFGPALQAVVSVAEVSTSTPARVAVDMAQGTFRPDNLTTLQRLEQANPDETIWKLLLARSLGLRDPDRTVSLLRAAIELDSSDLDSRIRLGNVFFRLGKNEQAGVLYREVLEIEPEHALALFNLSRIRLALFEFDEAEELLGRVRRNAPKQLARYEALSGEGEVVEPTLTTGLVARRVVLPKALASVSAGVRFGNALTLGAGAALLFGLLLGAPRSGTRPRRCAQCGVGVCPRCAPSDLQVSLCSACGHLSAGRGGLAPKARSDQTRRVERYLGRLRRGRRLVQLIWPGLSLIHEGRLALGIALAAAWGVLLLGALAPQALLPSETAFATGLLGPMCRVLLPLLWLIAQTPWLRPGAADAFGRR